MEDTTNPEPIPRTPEDVARHWLASISQSQKSYEKFYKRGDRVTKRYRSESEYEGSEATGSKFNLFWSNVQTLAPATYSRRPKVEVFRRFRDQDPIGRLAAQILERALQYEIDCGQDFHHALESCVLDRLLPGQAVAWVRYQPTFGTQSTEVPDPADPLKVVTQEVEVLEDEKTPVDYVYWKDFLPSPARGWQDVRWVARRVMFGKEALRKRFGETVVKFGGDIEDVPCNYDPTQADPEARSATGRKSTDHDETLRRALVWEIWDKESKQLFWVCPGYQFPLDIVDDPIHLEGFFPCPMPLWATMTTDTLIPVPDFVLYHSQLRELDAITARISSLTSALRVVGVYDASQQTLATLLQSGIETRMVPVNQWAAFAEKGGLKGVTDFVPIEQVFKVLQGLYEAREALKQTVYEITGMADIVRGATVASETLGAQQIKAKFANLRLSSRQQQVALFASAILSIKAEMMCYHYSPETLARIASADQIAEAQQHPERVQQALALLKDEKTRRYRIQVAEGSMIELDTAEEQSRRDTFMSSISNFMNAMKNVSAIGPEMIPVAFEMLKFVVRGFPTGRGLESSLEDAADKVQQRMAAPQPPPQPDPNEVLKADVAKLQEQAETQRTQMELASKEKIAGATVALKNQELQLDGAVAASDAQQSQDELATQQAEVQQQAQAAAQQQAQAAEQSKFDNHMRALEQESKIREATDTAILRQLSSLVESMQRLRRQVPVYDPDTGDITEVREEYVQ